MGGETLKLRLMAGDECCNCGKFLISGGECCRGERCVVIAGIAWQGILVFSAFGDGQAGDVVVPSREEVNTNDGFIVAWIVIIST